MKSFLWLLALLALPTLDMVFAGQLVCQAKKGAYSPPGEIEIKDASDRDPSLIGAMFSVNSKTGEIGGNRLFANGGKDVRLIRTPNSGDIPFSVVSVSNQSDVSVLRIREFEGKTEFHFFSDWLGLFLAGNCQRD